MAEPRGDRVGLATLGQMKFRILPASPETPNEALLMIRHPNNSGMQMD
jgi:hypothetical protein